MCAGAVGHGRTEVAAIEHLHALGLHQELPHGRSLSRLRRSRTFARLGRELAPLFLLLFRPRLYRPHHLFLFVVLFLIILFFRFHEPVRRPAPLPADGSPLAVAEQLHQPLRTADARFVLLFVDDVHQSVRFRVVPAAPVAVVVVVAVAAIGRSADGQRQSFRPASHGFRRRIAAAVERRSSVQPQERRRRRDAFAKHLWYAPPFLPKNSTFNFFKK